MSGLKSRFGTLMIGELEYLGFDVTQGEAFSILEEFWLLLSFILKSAIKNSWIGDVLTDLVWTGFRLLDLMISSYWDKSKLIVCVDWCK